MELNFQTAIADDRIGGQAGIIRLANGARTPADYLLETILPERNLDDYEASDASMTVRSIMAGMVGMDSKYPEGGTLELSTFRETILKVAIQQNLSEEVLRQLQRQADRIFIDGGDTTDLAVRTVLNFVTKLLLQPQWDRAEWLRAQALFRGAVQWAFNGSVVNVSYGIPAGNILATRTGTDAYGGSASKWWDDYKAARRILGASYRVAIARRDTIEAIIYNPVNNINVLGIEGGVYRIQRFRGSLERPSTDARETASLIEYDAEGEILDLANPGRTIKVPFVPAGVVGHFGAADRSREFIPGEGATENPDEELALGYTHIGPTTENGGAPGTWARVYTPEEMPMQLRGQSVRNVMPVIRNKNRIVHTSTAL